MPEINVMSDSRIDEAPAAEMVDVTAFTRDPYAAEFDDFRAKLRAHLSAKFTESQALLAQETNHVIEAPHPYKRCNKTFFRLATPSEQVKMTNKTAFLKRLLDILGSSLLLILLFIPMVVISAVIRFCSPGPIIVKSLRQGYGGRPFMRYRFRTTVITPAPEKCYSRDLDNYAESLIGSFLQKSKLQDLPELINVLKGEMSLVGPQARHPWLHQHIETDAEAALRHWRPGIVGETQIRYRAERRLVARQNDPVLYFVNFLLPAETGLEMKYIKEHSLLLDLGLIWKTVGLMTMIFRPNARKSANIWEASERDLHYLFGTKTPTPGQISEYFLNEKSRFYPWASPLRLNLCLGLLLRFVQGSHRPSRRRSQS